MKVQKKERKEKKLSRQHHERGKGHVYVLYCRVRSMYINTCLFKLLDLVHSIHNCMYVVHNYIHTTVKKCMQARENADVTDEKCTKTGVLFPAYY